MCPICISAAAWAAIAGTGSSGGLATMVAVKLRVERKPDDRSKPRHGGSPQSKQEGGGK